MFSRSGRSLDPGTSAEDAVLADPAVDPATVVPELEAFPLACLHQMQVLPAIHLGVQEFADARPLQHPSHGRGGEGTEGTEMLAVAGPQKDWGHRRGGEGNQGGTAQD